MSQAIETKRSVDRMMVRIEHLDKLLSLAGEVIITSSTLHDLQRGMVTAESSWEQRFEETLETIRAADESTRRMSQDLHDLVMAIRLVEMGETFRLFRRPIRDLCRSLGRDVDLRFEGEGVLIDKALAERIVEPLLHILRNSVDHGIETALERSRAGKPEQGSVIVRAVDRENSTEISIWDDGRGIHEETVVAAARAEGFYHQGDRAIDILCRPGFSTRDQATTTSGRGVGLHSVQTVVGEFGGSLELKSKPGEFTQFILDIPKLRAVNIVDALLVRAGVHYCAMPIEKVAGLVGATPAMISTTMEREKCVDYLGDMLPVLDLCELLGDSPLQIDGDVWPLVVIEGKHGRVAVLVSEYLSPQKLVNVPLSDSFGDRGRGIAGTTVLSGGRVGLTLDVDEIVTKAIGEPLDIPTADWGSGPGSAASTEGRTARTGGSKKKIEAVNVGDESPEIDETAPVDGASSRMKLDEVDLNDLTDEVRRTLAELQDALLSLESQPDNVGLLNDAFRRLHAAKGNFTMIGRDVQSEVAHQLETVLDFIRSRRRELSAECMDTILDGVSYLSRAADLIPGEVPPPEPALVTRLADLARPTDAPLLSATMSDVVQQAFTLGATQQLQLLTARKRSDRTYETLITFDSGRQSNFLVAYLILRRLGLAGTVFATLPPMEELEQGRCEGSVKVLWSTAMDADRVDQLLDDMRELYGVLDHHTITATIFRYERE